MWGYGYGFYMVRYTWRDYLGEIYSWFRLSYVRHPKVGLQTDERRVVAATTTDVDRPKEKPPPPAGGQDN